MQTKHFAVLFALFLITSFYVMGSGVLDLLYYALRSFIRMAAAYAVSIMFSFLVGLLIIHNKRAYEYIFPVVDVLQAIPILGFLPFAIILFSRIVPANSVLGPELSSVFLIFTSMTWAVLFAVVESGASITNEMRDLAKILNLKGMRYLTQMVLPVSFPQFVSGSIAGWGGGWYFLVAAEYLNWGNQPVKLPGLGSFISQSAFNFDLVHSALGVAMLAFIVFGMNLYVWQPLLSRARSFSSMPAAAEKQEKEGSDALMGMFASSYGKLKSFLEGMQSPTQGMFEFLSISPKYSTSHEEVSNRVAYFVTGGVFVIFLYFLILHPPALESFSIIPFVARSILRILIAFFIALIWTAAVAIFLARNKTAMSILMPIFDLGQSIPAVSIFPVIVVVVVELIGKELNLEIGLEAASIILVLTGMQWYLLFNLIRAVQNIPDEVLDLSSLFSLKTVQRLRHIMVPAIMPAVFVGGLEAMGGGWNASIVSEYIISPGGAPYQMPGLGFLLSQSSAGGDMNGVILAVCAITLLILIPHQLIWKPMVRESYKYKF